MENSSMLDIFFNQGYFLYIVIGFPILLLCLHGLIHICEGDYNPCEHCKYYKPDIRGNTDYEM